MLQTVASIHTKRLLSVLNPNNCPLSLGQVFGTNMYEICFHPFSACLFPFLKTLITA